MFQISNLKTFNYKFLYIVFLIIHCPLSIITCIAQNNRLTNEKGDLLWQYSQNVSTDEKNSNKIAVTFVFINGIHHTAISLRQELFHSQIEWMNTSEHPVEKEEYVDFVTVNLQPNQSVVIKYLIKNKKTSGELLLEKSAVLIMSEDFEVRKEVIPEQKLEKQK